jgi:hypothetical protein
MRHGDRQREGHLRPVAQFPVDRKALLAGAESALGPPLPSAASAGLASMKALPVAVFAQG